MSRTVALARSTHPGPSIAVTLVTVLLGVAAGLEPWRLVVLGLALLANQVSVGLSNDWIDADRDASVGRTDKPIARGEISRSFAARVAVISAVASIALTVPLGWRALLAYAVMLGSAWSYNLLLKRTPLSVVPYVVSFGALPLIATLALPAPHAAAWWAIVTGSLLGVAAHLANVLPDLDDDAATGVQGLPHRLGRRTTGVTIAAALGAASVLVALGPGRPGTIVVIGLVVSLAIAALTVVLVLARPATRLLFRLIISAAVIDVVMLVLAGRALVR